MSITAEAALEELANLQQSAKLRSDFIALKRSVTEDRNGSTRDTRPAVSAGRECY